jgi:hypothetical protein
MRDYLGPRKLFVPLKKLFLNLKHNIVLLLPMAACGCPWLPMDACGCPWLPMDACGCPWMPVAAHDCPWLPMAAHDCPWLPMTAHGCLWLPMTARGCLWLSVATCNYPFLPISHFLIYTYMSECIYIYVCVYIHIYVHTSKVISHTGAAVLLTLAQQ